MYASRASGNWDIYLQRVGGRNAINLTRDCLADDTQAAFSPDGQRVAFRSERDGGGIFVMGATGESIMRVTDFGYHPAWSPEGQRLLYSVQGLGSFIIEAEKPWTQQSPQALGAPGEPGVWFWARSWSPDGRSLAGDLQRPEGGYSGIAIYSLELKKYRRLTDFGAFARWLRDGRRLLFADESKLYLVDSESRRIREILSVAPHRLGLTFALSRDQRLIVFPLEVTEADVWLMSRP